jgi:hypothetical protein
MVSLCAGMYNTSTHHVVSCTRVFNYLQSSSRNTHPLLLPGSCVFNGPAHITYTLVEPYSERVCGVGAVTALVGLTAPPSSEYMEQMTAYNVVVHSCVCYKDYVGSDVPPTITITQAIGVPGHIPSCHYVLSNTQYPVGVLPTIVAATVVDTACGTFDMDVGRCLDLTSGPQYLSADLRRSDSSVEYSHVRHNVCVCPGAYDRWSPGIHLKPTTGYEFDYTQVEYCSCQIICQDGWTDSEYILCSTPVVTRPCRARQGDFSLCVPNPMQATGCLVYAHVNASTPVLVPGSCVYSDTAVADICGRNAVSGSVVLYNQTSGWPTFQENGWRLGYGYIPGAMRWGTDHRGAVMLDQQGTAAWQLWSAPRCVCVEPHTAWRFQVWQDVHAEALYNCDTWLDVARYGHEFRLGIRDVDQCGGNHTGPVSSLLAIPEHIVSDFQQEQEQQQHSLTVPITLEHAAALPYIGIVTSCNCTPFPAQIETAINMFPHCSWVLNTSTTVHALPSYDRIESQDLCESWAATDPHWSCTQSLPHTSVECGPGTSTISTVCPTNYSTSEQVALSSLLCIDYCQCNWNVDTIETPCDAVVVACTDVEVVQFCGNRASGAPYSQCTVHSLIVDANTRKFVSNTCSGYTSTWTSGCGMFGVLDSDVVCTPGTCNNVQDVHSWCGPDATSCLRHGEGNQWEDVCTCVIDKDSRVSDVWKTNNTNRRAFAASSCARWPTTVFAKRRIPVQQDQQRSGEYAFPRNKLLANLGNWFNIPLYHSHDNTIKTQWELHMEGVAALDYHMTQFSSTSIAAGGMGIPMNTSTSIDTACGSDSQGYDIVLYRGTRHTIPTALLWSAWSSTGSDRPEPQPGSSDDKQLVYMVRIRCICVHANSPYDQHSQWVSPENHPYNWLQQDTRQWEAALPDRVSREQSTDDDDDDVSAGMCAVTNRSDLNGTIWCNTGSSTPTMCINNAKCSADGINCICGRGFRGVNARGAVDCHETYNHICATGCTATTDAYTGHASCVCPGPWKQVGFDSYPVRVSTCLDPLEADQDPCPGTSTCVGNNDGVCVCSSPYTSESGCVQTTCYDDEHPEHPTGCRGRGICQVNHTGCACNTGASGELLWLDRLCAVPWCAYGQCHNGGVCTTAGSAVPECLCVAGTYGPTCEFSYIPTSVSEVGGRICSNNTGTDSVMGPVDFVSSVCHCQLGAYGNACQWNFNDTDICGTESDHGWCSGRGNCIQTVTQGTGLLAWECKCTDPLYRGSRCADSICPISSNGVACHSLDTNNCQPDSSCQCSEVSWSVHSRTADVTDTHAMRAMFATVVLLGETCGVSVLDGCADRPVANVAVNDTLRTISVLTLCGGDNVHTGRCVVDNEAHTARCQCAPGYLYTSFGNISRCVPTNCPMSCLYGTCTVHGTCMCTKPTVWNGQSCNISMCGTGTSPVLSAVNRIWKCRCNDPRYSVPGCVDLLCPTEDGIECGDHWFIAPGSPGSEFGHAPIFPFMKTLAMPTTTGVSCDKATGTCDCFNRVYTTAASTGTCVPLVSRTNTASIVAVHANVSSSDLIVVCVHNSIGRPWDPDTGCHSHVCNGNGVAYDVNNSACANQLESVICCCDEQFSGQRCEIHSYQQVCRQNSVATGTGCRCVYPWQSDSDDQTQCTVSRCSAVGTDAVVPIGGDNSGGYWCNCTSLYTGEFCQVYRHIHSLYVSVPTYTQTSAPHTNSPTVSSKNRSLILNTSRAPTPHVDLNRTNSPTVYYTSNVTFPVWEALLLALSACCAVLCVLGCIMYKCMYNSNKYNPV